MFFKLADSVQVKSTRLMEIGKEAEKRRVCFPKTTHVGFPERRGVLGKGRYGGEKSSRRKRASVFVGGSGSRSWQSVQNKIHSSMKREGGRY